MLVMINVFDKTLTVVLPVWLHTGTLLSGVIYFREYLKNIVSRYWYIPAVMGDGTMKIMLY
ncbi:MAG: hypothetical protein H5T43_09660 [Methanomethylovorans sp.]|jgi:hypothetical protein|nr:hypothetical protein [Methanomethylovorans sp.]